MGTLSVLSTMATYSIEEVAAAAQGPLWFQLYFMKERAFNRGFVERAEQAGYKAIVVTVDNTVDQFWQEREYRVDDAPVYTLDLNRLNKNFESIGRPPATNAQRVYETYELSHLAWSDLDWLRTATSLPIVVKGIQTAEDALRCVEHGMNGLVVSNHGGHTMNRLSGTIETLPEVVEAVDGKIEVYLDGGIRTGIDVLMALALGARAVLLGRAVNWGLTLGGESGVMRIFDILRHELDLAMGLCGVRDAAAVDRRLVERC
jgi:isopentenyl diphosphate isomerase/L-lactate dehydrogenase-like FMN-dependent dehydrogenase